MELNYLKKIIKESIQKLKEQADLDMGMDVGMTGDSTISTDGDRQGASDSSPQAKSMAAPPSSNYSPGITVTMATCADVNTPSYFTFCMPTTASPQVGSTYVNTNTVNSPIEGVKGFVMNIGGQCNSIQNGAQWQTTSVPVGSCPACCDSATPLPYDPAHTSIWGSLGYQAQGACVQACSSTGGGGCMSVIATKCAHGGGNPVGTSGNFPCPYIDGQPATTAHIGQQMRFDGTMHPDVGNVWTIDSVTPNPNYPANWTPNSSLTTQGANCASNPPSGCPGCNGGNHVWGNETNWQNNFTTNMQNASWFNAPNQPCQFLNNRITHWEGIQAGLGGCNAYYNQLECKIKYVDAVLKPQYNC